LPDVTSEAPATRWHDGQISVAGKNVSSDKQLLAIRHCEE
jgi:hypothetical protein